jgi:hypothetical protein
MRNLGGRGFPREDRVCFRKERRDRSPTENHRLNPARSGEESRERRDLESEGIALPAGPEASCKNWEWASHLYL